MTDTFAIRALISRKGLRGLTVAEATEAHSILIAGNARDQQLARTIERNFPDRNTSDRTYDWTNG